MPIFGQSNLCSVIGSHTFLQESFDLDKVTDIKKALQSEVLRTYVEEYNELSDLWRDLDRKAQGTVAIAGIFIASAFAFVKQLGPGTNLLGKGLLGFILFALVSSVVYCLSAMRIRKVARGPIGQYLNKLVKDLLKIGDPTELSERIPRFTRDQAVLYSDAVKSLRKALDQKAVRIWWAQRFLTAAILAVALYTLIILFGPQMEELYEMYQGWLHERSIGR